MKSEMETIQILSSKLREEELENERLRRERDMESEKALRAAEDARVARESAEQYRAQLEEERRAQGDRIESMLKEVMMFITGKGTASLSESLSDSIIKKMHEQHAKELADQKAADEERFRKMDEEHRIREAALESRIRELEDIRNNNDGHDQGAPGEDSQKHFHTLEEAEAAYLNEKRKNDDLNRLRFAQSTEGKYAGRTVVDADAADMKGEDAPDSTYDNVPPEAVKEHASLIARYQELDRKMGKYADFYETVPENVNLIGIICDVYDGIDSNVDDANEILSDAGAGFMNLRTSDTVYDVIDGIQVIPSSFLVDREGHIIGEIMQGQRFDATISRLNGYLK